MPKVTVVVPVYRVENYLSRCLDSLLTQSISDYEVICVNDCSPDHCQEILEGYQARYPQKVRLLENQENLGQGRSRERGICEAQGDYLMFVDSDDYVREDYIETYLRYMEQSPVDVLIGGYTRDVDGKKKEHRVTDSIWSILSYTIGCAKMYRTSFLREHQIGFSDARRGEDIYFSMELFYYGASYAVIDYCGYCYYLNRASTTGAMNYEDGFERHVADMFDGFLASHDLSRLPEERQRAIEYHYIANMVNALVTYGHGCGIANMREKYDFWMRDMQKKFPDYRHNPYVGIFRPKGQSAKIRLGVGIVMGLMRMRLARPLLYAISLI